MISFGGTSEPCAYVTLTSIGRLGVEENKKHSHVIMEELKKIGVASTRCYIYFQDVKPFEIGFNKTTFADILK
jgi:phenylpyruvate tautomerase